eukprot:scpid79418/ scgid13851/ Gelsolin-like protein 1; Actin-modulator
MSGLVKGKEYDWKDSNLALFGSDLEKNIKKASAETEKAWSGAGEKVGVEIWRIEKFQVKAWPSASFGKFYSGDSYIILNTYKEDGEDELQFDVHFWIGRHSTQDEYGTAAYKTVELDNLLDDKPIQHREVQGYESSLFKKYFKQIEIWSGGIESGFNHVEPEKYTPRLLHFSGDRRGIQVNEVDCIKENLNSEDVFILDLGLTIFQFNGTTANKDEKMEACKYVASLKSSRGKASSEVLDEADTSSKHEFFSHLGSGVASKKIVDSDFKKTLFRLSDSTGDLKLTQVAEGTLSKSMLDSSDVFILDTGVTCFVWVGKGASKQEKAKSMMHASNYVAGSNHPFVPITRVVEGQRNVQFCSSFDE